jgi:hypothetical protein
MDDIPGFVAALLAGETYIHAHTTTFPDGEIRGQIEEPAYDLDD